MCSSIKFRIGDEKSLVDEFIQEEDMIYMTFEYVKLDDPEIIEEDKALAVHFANAGAQGELGSVKILYHSEDSVEILRGNYVHGKLDLDALMQKLPILKILDARYKSEASDLTVGSLDAPADWGYVYMGAGNHFFAKKEICDKISKFIKLLLENGGYYYQVFDAAAWLCCAKSFTLTDDYSF